MRQWMIALGLAAAATLGCGGDEAEAPAAATDPAPAEVAVPAPTPISTPAEPTAAVEVPAEAAATAPIDLLRSVPTALGASSAYREEVGQLARLVDGDLETSWNSRSGDLVGAWLEVRVPEGATVTSIELTAGFTRVRDEGTDLFAGNHRVTRVRVSRDGTELGVHSLDAESRALQSLPVEGPAGLYRLEVLDVVAGSRADWREACISELRVMGRAPGGRPGAFGPRTAIGETPAIDEAASAAAAVPVAAVAAADAAAADPTAAPAADSTAAPGPAALHSTLDALLEEHLGEPLRDPMEGPRYVALGALASDENVVAMVARSGDDMGRETVTLVVGLVEQDGRRFFALPLGEASYEPGADASVVVALSSPLMLDHGVLRAELSVTTKDAEYSTCSDCQSRTESAEVLTRYALLCAQAPDELEYECTLIATALEIVASAGVVDDDGHRTAVPAEDPPAYRLSLTVLDGHRVRLALVSGELEDDARTVLGEVEISELGSQGDRLYGPDEE